MILDDRKRVIGKVVSVGADRFTVELLSGTDNFNVNGFDDVHYVAQVGSYVIIPIQADYLVAEVIGLRDKEANLSHSSPAEQELSKIEAAKFLEVVPVGTLPRRVEEFKFGVSAFPSLYSDVLYVRRDELDRIFCVNDAEVPVPDAAGMTRLKVLEIGKSVIFHDYDLKIGIDAFFGSHAAVLGNTGSGKSCTISAILQSLFAKRDFAAQGATFVVFDINGEYHQAFSKLPSDVGVRYLSLGGGGGEAFELPHWFLNIDEWELLLKASERTQSPILRTALGLASLFAAPGDGDLTAVRNHILASCIAQILRDESSTPSKKDRITALLSRYHTPDLNIDAVGPMIAVRFGEMADPRGLSAMLEGSENQPGLIRDDVRLPVYANMPTPFEGLEEALELAILYEEAHGNRQIRDYCSQLLTRFKSLKERPDFNFLKSDPAGGHRIDAFVEGMLGLKRRADGNLTKRHQLIVVDMNAAEDEVIEVASSVLTRLIFERLRRADPRNRFPVNLILEEAHRYVAHNSDRYFSRTNLIFERVAKEGRKYGLFLLLSSQRPSELSRTVLSQCSNFIVHRIQNPEDLSHIRQMTPHVSDTILRRLPSIPTQHALIFGNAVNIPTTFRVRTADPKPKSDNNSIAENWFVPTGVVVEL